jgi:soluble lytic murein transglycosylase-like protein
MSKKTQAIMTISMLFMVMCLAICDYAIFKQKYVHIDKVQEIARRAYQQGLSQGMEIAIDNSFEIDALYMLFRKYRLSASEARQYAKWILESSAKYRVPVIILAGLIMQESSCRADAVSSTGAVGLTQVTWRWWGSFLQDLGIAQDEADLFDPETSIEAGAAILAHLIDRYGSIERALEHYSGGAREYVAKVSRRVFAW